jgi:hypothetical protein
MVNAHIRSGREFSNDCDESFVATNLLNILQKIGKVAHLSFRGKVDSAKSDGDLLARPISFGSLQNVPKVGDGVSVGENCLSLYRLKANGSGGAGVVKHHPSPRAKLGFDVLMVLCETARPPLCTGWLGKSRSPEGSIGDGNAKIRLNGPDDVIPNTTGSVNKDSGSGSEAENSSNPKREPKELLSPRGLELGPRIKGSGTQRDEETTKGEGLLATNKGLVATHKGVITGSRIVRSHLDEEGPLIESPLRAIRSIDGRNALLDKLLHTSGVFRKQYVIAVQERKVGAGRHGYGARSGPLKITQAPSMSLSGFSNLLAKIAANFTIGERRNGVSGDVARVWIGHLITALITNDNKLELHSMLVEALKALARGDGVAILSKKGLSGMKSEALRRNDPEDIVPTTGDGREVQVGSKDLAAITHGNKKFSLIRHSLVLYVSHDEGNLQVRLEAQQAGCV